MGLLFLGSFYGRYFYWAINDSGGRRENPAWEMGEELWGRKILSKNDLPKQKMGQKLAWKGRKSCSNNAEKIRGLPAVQKNKINNLIDYMGWHGRLCKNYLHGGFYEDS
jgi:hypothetical protein